MNKLVLIGFMGSGKSSVAPLVAKALGYRAIEMDDKIMQSAGFTDVPTTFMALGESGFRELEAQVARSLRDACAVVISTGGGVVGRPSSIADLKHGGGMTVFLDTSFSVIHDRIKDIHSRPLFQDLAQARALFEERLPLYRCYADMMVSTDDKNPSQVCDAILAQLRRVSKGDPS